MGSLRGAIIGAAVWLLLPTIITGFANQAGESAGVIGKLFLDNKSQLVNLVFGTLVILLLLFAPGGINGIGRQLRDRLATWRKP